MSYVDDQLLPGEEIRHRAHLHKFIYVLPVLASLVLLAGATWALLNDLMIPGVVVLALAALPLLWAYVSFTSSEFAVTNKRVIIKVGWIQRRTLETILSKVEAIGVDQSIFGRMLGFGTITVTGTGGTKEPFPNIADPLDFRRHVQAQVSAAEENRRFVAEPESGGGAPREERDCPYCAERILVRAKVCKHCGRDV
ncbi:MAG: PH domain-containing protein [Gemmatimonadota bacterium]